MPPVVEGCSIETTIDASARLKNQLLSALPTEVCDRWSSQLELVEMRLGDVLHDAGSAIGHVYFPTTSTVSLLHILESGASSESAMVGSEGIVGISVFMGGNWMSNQSVVRTKGHGFRLPAKAVASAFEHGGAVAQLLLRYTQALMAQITLTAACNRHHSLAQQLCRLLLFSLDRQRTLDLWMTHEQISNMLGVRREGVTAAALSLQQAGLIKYSRGHITVVDRKAMELRSCECYAVVRAEYDRLLTHRPLSRQEGVRQATSRDWPELSNMKKSSRI